VEIVALVEDLFFGARIAAAAERAGVVARLVRSPADLATAARGASVRGVLLDLSVLPDETLPVAETLKRDRPDLPVIGFLPHVERERATRARQAGIDDVMPRSRFAATLPDVLRRLAGVPASVPAGRGQAPDAGEGGERS
jgi:CheY-like chemotaxis protein